MTAATRSRGKIGAEILTQGLKRRRTNNDTAISMKVRRSFHPSPTPSLASDDLENFEDDSDAEFEYIHTPKKHDWDIFRVPCQEPKDRDRTEAPFIATNHDGERVVMWAQMDYGAGANVINRSTVIGLLVVEEVQKQVRDIPEPETQDPRIWSHRGQGHRQALVHRGCIQKDIHRHRTQRLGRRSRGCPL